MNNLRIFASLVVILFSSFSLHGADKAKDKPAEVSAEVKKDKDAKDCPAVDKDCCGPDEKAESTKSKPEDKTSENKAKS